MDMNTTYSQQLVDAQQSLALWKEAERNVATGGKSYSIGDGDMLRRLERATPSDILANITYYSREITRLQRILTIGSRRIIHARGR